MSENHDPFQPPQIQPPQPPVQHPGQQQSASALDAIIPTNPLAAVSCWSGILGMLLCPLGILLGPLALVTGILAIKKWKIQETAYGATTSKVRAWIGMVTGTLGLLISLSTVVIAILAR